MPQLTHGSCCCCRQFQRQTLRRAHWLAGLLFACVCLTLAGLLNTDLPVSVTAVPSYDLDNTLNTVGAGVNPDLEAPAVLLRSPPQTIVAYSLERQVEMEQREPVLCSTLTLIRPTPAEIHRINIHWQSPPHSGLHLYSAHYDARLHNYHYVRIIGMVEGHRNSSVYCQVWYDTEVLVLEALRVEIWASQWDRDSSVESDNPVMFSCPIPRNISSDTAKRKRFPSGVSVTMKPCDIPRTFLPIDPPSISSKQRKDFAVCVKGLDFTIRDISVRIAEWLELNLILGADKFFMYVYSIHPNLKRVLEHYVSRGVLEVIPLSLPGKQPNKPKQRSHFLKTNLWQKRRDELVPYNDCYYRNLYTHRFVLPVDVDEVIVPVRTSTWKTMFQELFSDDPHLLDKYSSFSVRNAYFFDGFPTSEIFGVPKYHHILRHNIRSANFSPELESVKSFVSTEGALTVFNHYTLRILRPSTARNLVLDTTVAQMNHYRATCSAQTVPDCYDNFLKYKKRDTLILRYASELASRLNRVLRTLSLI